MSEPIVLEEFPHGKICVWRSDLLKKLSELWDDVELGKLSVESGLPLAALKNMTLIAFIKSDIADKNIMGYKKYQAILKKEGFDV